MSKKTSNLSFLLSSHRREYCALITADEIDELLKVARQAYDIVVVDVNSYPDNAATLRAVKQADERWVITDMDTTSYQTSWNDWYESVWEPYGLVLSDFGRLHAIFSPKASTNNDFTAAIIRQPQQERK